MYMHKTVPYFCYIKTWHHIQDEEQNTGIPCENPDNKRVDTGTKILLKQKSAIPEFTFFNNYVGFILPEVYVTMHNYKSEWFHT